MYRLTITTKAPVSAGIGGESGYLRNAHSFLPAPVVRGGLAARWIAEHGPPEASNPERATFLELFERGIRYGAAFPPGQTPEPLSALVCKYTPEPECAGWAVDLAFDSPVEECPQCGGPVRTGRGELRETSLETRTRTAIDPETQAAREGQLFRRRAIGAGRTLTALVAGRHPWLTALGETDVWFGGDRSVGGRSIVTAEEIPAPEVSSIANGEPFVLRFTSPAVLIGDDTLPRLTVSEEELSQKLGVDPVDIETEQWSRPTVAGGWHAASGLPKPSDVAVVAGTTLKVTAQGPLDGDKVKRLLSEGLGVRRVEGFGNLELITEPWCPQPPPKAPPAEETGRESDPDLAQLLKLPATERRWMARQLSDRMVARSKGRALPEHDYRRLRSWTEAQRRAWQKLASEEHSPDWGRLRFVIADVDDTEENA